jgi:hypothetical protein
MGGHPILLFNFTPSHEFVMVGAAEWAHIGHLAYHVIAAFKANPLGH